METLSKDMKKVLEMPEEMDGVLRQPARRYVKNARAILRTPADVYEHPSFYSFVIDMPGLQVSNIKVIPLHSLSLSFCFSSIQMVNAYFVVESQMFKK